ncbi:MULTISPECIES: hypothetical protein [unclassified Bradyrhizobium]|uniref:hypothetical protein n=1 Tax=unclassified Bradyrhizobium TaxID=2631580 RepID=UPI001CD4B596|nr:MULTISPECIES: hypothetical protein [unclassified Bradyrhizobium]MCA1428880.1 hypothetical protein [Bradyrhizobium sp. NBAIM16]MCA1503752.1 hypothetical protein [Bradyrhizobium sp. NBAIM02]MCA1514587.1 hypothetical protein [Bradyrhizobium sp. NBAIM01]
MAMGRTPPEDTKTNLLRWAEFFRLHRIPTWVRSQKVDVWARNASVIIAALSTGVATSTLRSLWSPMEKSQDRYVSEEQYRELERRYQESLRQLNSVPKSATPSPASNFFGLDDAKRWHISNILHSQTANVGSGKHCEGRLFSKPNDNSAQQLTNEIPPLLRLGSWHLEGGRNSKSAFPDGVTINVGQDTGPAFTCAYRLSEVLDNMKLKPVTLKVNMATPDLVECKECVEVIFGTIKRPE